MSPTAVESIENEDGNSHLLDCFCTDIIHIDAHFIVEKEE